ncbi:hypothetical protein [Leisingera sp. S232]|uniref:hypothetical protein n=1 Tax=Leisingera sp. S232 TaxID=3415132 RepID=UPI00086A3294|nr:hypothetical protein AB838_14875 [Rhodobacteraceae bacterium (ex Bugula neritina AB1)]
MQKPLALTLACALVLSACGWRDSRLNPSNWFGSSEPAEIEVTEAVNPLLPQESNARGIFAKKPPKDKSVLVSQIADLRIERTSTGAIIRAVGIAERQGAFQVELRPVEEPGEGILAYDFRIVYPEQPTITGSEFSRTLHAARTLSNQDLQDIQLVRVNGETNARESRRR